LFETKKADIGRGLQDQTNGPYVGMQCGCRLNIGAGHALQVTMGEQIVTRIGDGYSSAPNSGAGCARQHPGPCDYPSRLDCNPDVPAQALAGGAREAERISRVGSVGQKTSQ